MIVSGMLNIILKNKIKGKSSLINKLWKDNFLCGHIELLDTDFLLV